MSVLEIILISITLSLDAFSVSISKGMNINNNKIMYYLIISLCFGIFQAIMPYLGYTFSNSILKNINNIDHWIIFIILTILGIEMINEKENNNLNNSIKIKEILFLSIATSLDALTIGITFSLLQINIIKPIIIIGIITFINSYIGCYIGNKCKINNNKSKKIGGIILIIIGIKILLEHIL